MYFGFFFVLPKPINTSFQRFAFVHGSMKYHSARSGLVSCTSVRLGLWLLYILAESSFISPSSYWTARERKQTIWMKTFRRKLGLWSRDVSTGSSRSLFTLEERLGYRVAWWLVIITCGKTWLPTRIRSPQSGFLKVPNNSVFSCRRWFTVRAVLDFRIVSRVFYLHYEIVFDSCSSWEF